MKYLSAIILLLLTASVSAQTGSQRVHIISVDPPTVCLPGHFYTNPTASKGWMGSSVLSCVQISGAGSGATLGSNTFTGAQIVPAGTAGAPSLAVGDAANGMYRSGANTVAIATNGGRKFEISSSGDIGIMTAAAALFWTTRASLTSPADGSITITNNAGTAGTGLLLVGKYNTGSNCSDSAGAAACGSAIAGSVVMDAAATTVVVSTTNVTANSQIFIQEDSSLGTRLSVTCNTTTGRDFTVTARTAATSFTITSSAAPVTNPSCLSFFITN